MFIEWQNNYVFKLTTGTANILEGEISPENHKIINKIVYYKGKDITRLERKSFKKLENLNWRNQM